jgi:hypothetical protein
MPPALHDLDKLITTPTAPDLGPGPRPGVWDLVRLDAESREPLNLLAGVRRQLARATIYLWHDHLENAHSIAQGIENSDGSYLHAILHRREPDYSNARYWFDRVGQHPCFLKLAPVARQLLSAESALPLQKGLLPNGKWDPVAFIDACERVGASSGNSELLRAIQAAELKLLFDYFLGG